MNSVHLLQRDQKTCREQKGCSSLVFLFFRERESTFSLDFRPIGSSVLNGARSKVILRGEGYVWAPIWCSENSKR